MRLLTIILLLARAWCGSGLAQDELADIRAEVEASAAAIEDLAGEFVTDTGSVDLAALEKRANALAAREEELGDRLAELEARLEEQRLALVAAAEASAAGTPEGGEPGDEAPASDLAEQREAVELAMQQLAEVQLLASANDAAVGRLIGAIRSSAELKVQAAAVQARRGDLERIEEQLAREDAADLDLLALREELRRLRDAEAAAMAPIAARRDELGADLERLGPEPAEGEAPEADRLAAERTRLTAALAETEAVLKQGELNLADAGRILELLAAKRREVFYSEIFQRGPSPLSPAVWRTGASGFAAGIDRLSASLAAWREARQGEGDFVPIVVMVLGALGLGIALVGPVRGWIVRRVVRAVQRHEPTAERKAVVALAAMASRAIPGLVATGVLFQVLTTQVSLSGPWAPTVRLVFACAAAMFIAGAAVRAVSAGEPRSWRLVPLREDRIGPVRVLILLSVFVYFLDRVMAGVGAALGAPQELVLLQTAVFSVLIATCIGLLASRAVWQKDPAAEVEIGEDSLRFWNRVRVVVRLVAGIVIAAALLGYVSLAYFVATALFELLALVGIALLVRAIVQGAARGFLGRISSSRIAGEDADAELVFFWAGAAIDAVLLVVFLPPAAVILGADWQIVRDVVVDAMLGFNIGSVRISLAKILLAIGVFVSVLSLTKFVQRTAEARFFPRMRMDPGVSNSLRTLIGYVGLVFGVMIAVQMIGFNLSNLAIIAGALSVGIGFGLQSIVSNFVSGLILLFERPVKVGDWIITTAGEGIVKRISVRSTEIETWDRSSVIVPNSELITGAVTNWTHTSNMGRVVVPVGVSYDADPRQVMAILLDCAKSMPQILRYPEPFVVFNGFGDSALDFDVRGFISDIRSSLGVKTELRCRIFEALKEHGIEIPFPQRTVHMAGEAPLPGGTRNRPDGEAEEQASGSGDSPSLAAQ